jgi:4,5-DOPA dioxygenase extradiol
LNKSSNANYSNQFNYGSPTHPLFIPWCAGFTDPRTRCYPVFKIALGSIPQTPSHLGDFSGFPAALYDLQYPAPGAPELADRVMELIDGCELHSTRGLDHGTWTPLMLAYPEADIPVTQLSIQPDRDPTYHWQLGQALAPLRDEGVLMIGSGSATHSFSAFSPNYETPPPQWVQIFDEWLAQTIERGDWSALLDYRKVAPFAIENHPTEEHLLPLFVALGAGGTIVQGMQLHRGYSYGAFSMAAYAFREES